MRVSLRGRPLQGLVIACREQGDASIDPKLQPVQAVIQAAAVDPAWRTWLDAMACRCHTSPFRMLKAALPPGWLGTWQGPLSRCRTPGAQLPTPAVDIPGSRSGAGSSDPRGGARALGAGKPVVVFRHGSFMEPPAGSVAGVPLDTFDTTGLSEVCRGLLCDESRREKIGCQARSWASSVTPAMSVRMQSAFLSECLTSCRTVR